MADIQKFSPDECRRDLILSRELAMLDMRSEAAFGAGHPLFASHLPFAHLDALAGARLPRRDVRTVLYDDGESLAERGFEVLRELGYTDVGVLEGGLAGWRAAGFEIFSDLHSWSKAFGELVAEACGTPSLTAKVVKALLDGGNDAVVVDARPAAEFQVMNIPGAINVPGAELVLRASEFAPDPATLIIVNCAGRTRSLIGAQSLLNAGVPNAVVALRNGTMGWALAGESLEHGQARRLGPPDPRAGEAARQRAGVVAYRAGVRRLSRADLADLEGDPRRTTYRFDVRSREEFERGRPPGFLHAPGGQLVQETDTYAPVRGARIVVYDDCGARADMTASWLAQMGCEAYVLDAGPEARLEYDAPAAGPEPLPAGEAYRRPHEGVDRVAAMKAYLAWEHGLVAQLARDATHGFRVLTPWADTHADGTIDGGS